MTNTELHALVRPNIAALHPYSSARDEAPQGGRPAEVFLDANENSLGSPFADGQQFNRYPHPRPAGILSRLSALKGVIPEQIFLGNGSDEAIDLLMRAFCEPGRDNVVLLPPTYGMYAVQANIHGCEIRRAPLLPDFSPDPAAVLACADAHSKLLFICSPNNPTGQLLPEAFVLEMLEKFPGVVVVDEAYIDFASGPSWVGRLGEFQNLVVLQTLSKAWGLAGLRLGMAFSNPFIISVLNKIKYPYNIGLATEALVETALDRPELTQQKVATLLAELARLEAELPLLPVVEHVFPSDANFLLVRVKDADATYQHLAAQGIIVRNRSKEMHCANCLRITVGTPEENDRLLAALA
jgi:histidinol-phosphate aminotransferase